MRRRNRSETEPNLCLAAASTFLTDNRGIKVRNNGRHIVHLRGSVYQCLHEMGVRGVGQRDTSCSAEQPTLLWPLPHDGCSTLLSSNVKHRCLALVQWSPSTLPVRLCQLLIMSVYVSTASIVTYPN